MCLAALIITVRNKGILVIKVSKRIKYNTITLDEQNIAKQTRKNLIVIVRLNFVYNEHFEGGRKTNTVPIRANDII